MTQRLFSIVCNDENLARDPAVVEWLEAVERQMNDGIEAAFQDFAVFGSSSIKVPLTQVERNARWRAKNRERYNVGQRDLMRKRRAKKTS